MHFPPAFVLAALSFLVGAVSAQNSARSVLSIPLSKRSTLSNADGLVDVQNLQASVRHTIAFVFPVLFLRRMDPQRSAHSENLSKDLTPSKVTLVKLTLLCRVKGIRTSAAVVPRSLSPTIVTIRCGMVTSLLGLLPPNILVGHYFERHRRRN
jgi:hypothetical protein